MDLNEGLKEIDEKWQEQFPTTDQPVAKTDDTRIGLEIPKILYKRVGQISSGIEALKESGQADIIQYQFPVICGHIANAIGGNMTMDGRLANTYSLKTGGTSTGKTEMDEAIQRAVRDSGRLDGFYGPDEIASGPGLARYLSTNPQCLTTIDEGSSLFRKSQGNPTAQGIKDFTLRIYNAKGRYEKSYAKKEDNIIIEDPCVSFLINTTPVVLDEIDRTDFETGLMQRVDFFHYDGPIRHRTNGKTRIGLERFVDYLASLYNFQITPDCPLYKNRDVELPAAPQEMLQDLSTTTVNRANESEHTWAQGVIMRSYDLAKKYALTHHAATAENPYCDPLEEESLLWGIDVARAIADWKINILHNRTYENDFHRDCSLMMDAIRACLQKGKNPTKGVLADRKTAIKGWTSSHFNDVVSALVTSVQITVQKSSGGHPMYLPRLDQSGPELDQNWTRQ